ncbi:RNA polymerase sigma factor [Streptomyces sp. NPDC055794]
MTPASPSDAGGVPARGQRAGGHDDAFASFYTRWAPEVRGWVRHQLFDEHEVDDVVQQVFLAAWQAQHTYHPDRGPLVAWLSGITKHKINDAISARTRRRERHDRYAQRHGPDKAQDTLTDQLPGHLDSVRLLQLLSGPQRQVLYLAYWHDLTQSEIAARLDMPVGTVKSHTRRALQHLTHHTRSRRAVIGQPTADRRVERSGPVTPGAPG